MSHNIHSAKLACRRLADTVTAFLAVAADRLEGDRWSDAEIEGLGHLRTRLAAAHEALVGLEQPPALEAAANAADLAVRAALQAEAAPLGEMSRETYPLAEGLAQALLAVAYELRAARLEAEARARGVR